MLDLVQFRELVIKPALMDLQLYSPEAMELLIFTCAVESNGGQYLKQINGPALGIYQMEPVTYNDIWANYINYKGKYALILSSNFDAMRMPSEDRMIYDLRFATAMARMFYVRIKEKLPDFQDVDAIWEYYKKYYNTPKGKAEKVYSIDKYKQFVKGSLPDSSQLVFLPVH